MVLQPFTLFPDLVLQWPKELEREMPRALLGHLQLHIIKGKLL